MSTWPREFRHLTAAEAWEYVRFGDMVLSELSDIAKEELAGLSSFGKSGQQPEMLYSHIHMATMGGSTLDFDTEHVRSALRVLKVADPEQNSGIPDYDPWAE